MIGPRLLSLASATAALTPGQARMVGGMLDTLARMDARRTALQGAVAILDGGQGLSRWALAQRLETHLRRFAAVGMRRVASGDRLPSDLEVHLLVILETSSVRCARKIWHELRGLPVFGQ